MRYYIIYLKALWRNRKELKQMIHSYLVSSGELLEYKKAKMISQDFTNKLTHQHSHKPTEQEVKAFLAGHITISPDTILKK